MRCGTLTEERDWRNGGEVDDERQTEDGQRLSIRRCDECFFVWEGAGCVCPVCGEDNGQDLRISKKCAIELPEKIAAEIEGARKKANLAAKQSQGRAQTLDSLTATIMKKPGTKNRFSARASAVKVLTSRMEKAERQGNLGAALDIYSELTWSGVTVSKPGDDDTDDLLSVIEQAAS